MLLYRSSLLARWTSVTHSSLGVYKPAVAEDPDEQMVVAEQEEAVRHRELGARALPVAILGDESLQK